MTRSACLVLVAIALSVLRPSPGLAEPVSLIGHWVHCDPSKGCLRFAFLPNGKVIEQYPLGSAVMTAYGTYERGTDRLRIKWSKVSPGQICLNGSTDPTQCLRTGQRNIKGSLAFTGFNALTWSFAEGPPLQLLRVLE